MARIVIALGGNALGNTPETQLEKARVAAESVAKIVLEGHEVVLCHGNGPQVGMIDLAFFKGAQVDATVPSMPLAECTAMSQGYIGYHLQQALTDELARRGSARPCVSLVTEVLVDAKDPAFASPSKPIGPFLDEETGLRLRKEYPDLVFREDAGRGWREYVASPRPVEILQKEPVLSLVNAGCVVIACGGGGVPVVEKDGTRVGVQAVIDKDLSAAKLAEVVDAKVLVILTAVDHVAINWGTPEKKDLNEVTVEEMKGYLKEGQFAEGSMKPKVEAVLSFLDEVQDGEAIIGSLEQAAAVLSGGSGTRIRRG